MADLILYSYWRSSSSYRVRIALNLKALPYEYRAVHLLRDGGEQKKPEYTAINPAGMVPCLVDGDRVLTESMAIIEYLDAVYPDPPLFPFDPFAAAQVRTLCEGINAGVQPLHNSSILQEIAARYQASKEATADWARHFLVKGMRAMEARLAKTAGTFCFGDNVTAADVFLVPQVFTANRYAVDMTAYPLTSRINQACLELKAFQNAEPSLQPDAVAPA